MKRTITVVEKQYCKDCWNQNLELSHDKTYMGDELYEDAYTLKCEHYASCSQLWNHFVSTCKEHINNSDDEKTTVVTKDGVQL